MGQSSSSSDADNSDSEASDDWLGTPEELEEIIGIEDDDQRHEAYLSPGQMLLGELTIYGQTQDPFMIGDLRFQYEIVVDDNSVGLREEIYGRLIEGVAQGDLDACVLLPFIGCEPEGILASRAVIDYCMRVPRPQDPPETGMRIVGGIIRSGQAVNPGAAFGGLLCLGDRRAHPWLLDIRDQLSVAEIEQAVRIRTGFLSAATVEFYLGWMEERQRDADGRVFGALAAGLVNQVVASKVPMIMTGLRTIPPGRVPEDQETKVAAWVPLEGYAEQIAPRLLALDAAEREPKVMPEVLRAWGIAGQG